MLIQHFNSNILIIHPLFYILHFLLASFQQIVRLSLLHLYLVSFDGKIFIYDVIQCVSGRSTNKRNRIRFRSRLYFARKNGATNN